MNPWSWFKSKMFGELVEDYGTVLDWGKVGSTKLRLELRRKDEEFFLATRTTSSIGIGGEVSYSSIPVSTDKLDEMIQLLQRIRERIRVERGPRGPDGPHRS
jgi:hypothetical protein